MSGFISGLYSIPLVYVSVFILPPHCFTYCNFLVSFEIRKSILATLFFFKSVSAIPDSFRFNFRMGFSISVEKKCLKKGFV